MKNLRHFAGLALLTTSAAFAAPTLDPAEDSKHLGEPMRFLFWEPNQQVAGYRNMDKVFPTRQIEAGDNTYHLGEDLRDLGDVKMEVEDEAMSVDRFFEQYGVAGLLVIKNGDVVYERYGLGNTRDSRWVSFSVAKSVTSMLVGAAIKDGYIDSVDESVTDYLPRLKGSSYDQTTIRDILRMSSGVRWNEDYADPESDLNQTEWPTLSLYEYLRHLPRDAEPGQKFDYNSAETNLVGTLLRSAIGNNLSTYLTEKSGGHSVWSQTQTGC
jgi:CubicO group peptidase (beta-lactamase class C family)